MADVDEIELGATLTTGDWDAALALWLPGEREAERRELADLQAAERID